VPPRATLTENAPSPEYEEDTVVCPVRLHEDGTMPRATPLADDGPADLGGWANADAIAIIPPGSDRPGDVVVLLDPLGRPAGATVH
jgi:molybdopterin biosynthesis enzyme